MTRFTIHIYQTMKYSNYVYLNNTKHRVPVYPINWCILFFSNQTGETIAVLF